MKKILYPTDFSKASLHAFPFALHLAKKIHAQIITLHVYEIENVAFADYHDYIMEIYDVKEWEEFDNFKGEVPKLREIAEREQLGRVEVQHVLMQGVTKESILNVAKTEKVDFIVMGTKGATGLKEVFLGTITQKVMNSSTVPVIAIPENYSYKPLKKILFLTDYDLSQLSLLKKVDNLARLFNAEVDVLKVSMIDDGQDILFSEKWKKMRPQSEVNFYLLHEKDVEGTIMEFVDSHKVNCVVVAIRQYGFFEKLFRNSLSKKLVFHSELPLLSVYDQEEAS